MMASQRPANVPSPANGNSFTTSLRFELADDEGRALLGSYAISSTIGLAFLLLLHFGPRADAPISLLPRVPMPIVVGDLRSFPEPTRSTPVEKSGSGTRARSTGASLGAILRALGGGSGTHGMVGDASGILRGIEVNADAGATGVGGGAKVVLGPGQGGQGSTAPGRGGVGGTGGAGGIGGVGGTGGVGRSVVNVGAPIAIPVAGLPALGRDNGEVGTYVRARSAQLQVCYERGLAINPNLAGSLTVAATIGPNGLVGATEITRRTWSGPGATEAEACILQAMGGWRLGSANGGAGTYSLPLSFTR